MFNYHYFKALFAFGAMAVTCAIAAKAQPTACLTKAEAEAIPVTWTDASGVEHTNTLADRATDPRHIIALLKEAYTNQDVPGIWQAAYSSSGVREDDVYYGGVRNNDNELVSGWDIPGILSTAYKPNQEGYTLFIVAVKDSYSGSTTANYGNMTRTQLINYFNSAVEYVELVPGGWRVNDTDNPGMMFTLSGEFSRFFFLSKGKARNNINSGNVTVVNGAQPFYRMFEEFSPYNSQSTDEDITDFYAKLVAGEAFPVEHDCTSVIGRGHYFSMAGKNATAKYDITGLNMLIPDYRLKYFRRTGNGPTDGRSDGTSSGTETARYVNYNPDYAPEMFMYAIILNGNAEQASEENHTYTVTLDWSSTYSTAESQTFAVYAVVNGVVQDTPIVEGLQNIYQWSTTVEQDTHGYTLTYVVRGKPDDAGFGEVSSNQVSVIIPGYDPQERLSLAISGSFESEYNIADQRNQYANYIIMNNGEGTCVTREYLAANSTFELHRYEEGAATPEEADKIVATMVVTEVGDNSCSYTVAYAFQDGADEAKYPPMQGTFAFDENGNVIFDNFMMCDQFSASTENNDHKDHYSYQIRFESEKEFLDINDEPTNEVYSNVTNVNVYKMSYLLGGDAYTQAQVDADTQADALLPLTGDVAMSFVALNDRNVLQYNMMSTDDQTRRAYAQNNNDGTYTAHNSDESTSVMSNTEVVITDNIGDAEVGTYGYVPVIETYRSDGSGNRNTYGADVKHVATLTAEIYTEGDKVMSDDTFNDSDNNSCRYYMVYISGSAQLPEGYEIYKVRLWRNCGDVAREVLDQYMYRLDQNNAIAEGEVSDDNTFIFNNDDAMTFGALDVLEFDPFTATYTVRVYARETVAVPSGLPRFAAAEPNYFIAEGTLDVVFDEQTITGVSDITADANVTSVRYYDAMGHASSKPFAGINVVVKTMSDGSQQATKVRF